MKKSELLEKLNIARPALSSKEFIPVFTCFCFTGTHVFAFNDLIAIETSLDWPVSGAIKGSTLLDLVRGLPDGDIKVSKKTDLASSSLLLKSGKSKLNLPLLDPEEFIFSFPGKDKGQTIPITEELVNAVKLGLISSSNDPSHPERMGETLIGDGVYLELFSTDGCILTKIYLGDSNISGTFILPYDFCKAFVDLAGKEGILFISGKSDYVVAELGNCRIFSKLISVNPVEFEGVFEDVEMDIGSWDKLLEVPKDLANALARASVVMQGGSPRSILEVKDGVLALETSSSYGIVQDQVSLDGHEDVRADIHPELLLKVLEKSNKFLIKPAHVLLSGDGHQHIVSNYL